jgi:hypothetical protein
MQRVVRRSVSVGVEAKSVVLVVNPQPKDDPTSEVSLDTCFEPNMLCEQRRRIGL